MVKTTTYFISQQVLSRARASIHCGERGRQTVALFPYIPAHLTVSSAGTAFIHSTRTTYSLSSSSLDRQYSPDSGNEKNGVPLIFTDAAGELRQQTEIHTSVHHPKTAAFARQGLRLWPRRSSRSIRHSILSFPRPISFRNRRRLYGLRIVRGGLRRSGIKHRCVPLLQAAQE